MLLTATSAGPGFFDTAHTSVWHLDPATPGLTHLSDLFFRRTDRPGVFGDHASHLLSDGDRWLLATSTWGDFDSAGPGASVGDPGRDPADLLSGRHVLDTVPLPLPTTGLRSVGVWDPHLVRTDDGWLVAYVSARRFFEFGPVLAGGPLDPLELRAAGVATSRPRGRRCTGSTATGGCWSATVVAAATPCSTSTCARPARSTRRTPPTSRGPPSSSTTSGMLSRRLRRGGVRRSGGRLRQPRRGSGSPRPLSESDASAPPPPSFGCVSFYQAFSRHESGAPASEGTSSGCTSSSLVEDVVDAAAALGDVVAVDVQRHGDAGGGGAADPVDVLLRRHQRADRAGRLPLVGGGGQRLSARPARRGGTAPRPPRPRAPPRRTSTGGRGSGWPGRAARPAPPARVQRPPSGCTWTMCCW